MICPSARAIGELSMLVSRIESNTQESGAGVDAHDRGEVLDIDLLAFESSGDPLFQFLCFIRCVAVVHYDVQRFSFGQLFRRGQHVVHRPALGPRAAHQFDSASFRHHAYDRLYLQH